MWDVLKPVALARGDTIGIAAPASWGERENGLRGAGILAGMGFNVRLGQAYSRRYGYLAGTDEERAEELNTLFADPGIKAILCARGGYGTGRIAELLDYDLIRNNPKVFWGYSDITFLHIAVGQYTGLVTFHGPMLIDLGKEDVNPLTIHNFSMMLAPPKRFRYTEEISPLTVLSAGEATGLLTGGNLSLLVSTLGTPFEWDTRGKIILLEDVGEEPYRVDRMLNQLRQAGKFRDAEGILIGDFCESGAAKGTNSLTLAQVFADQLLPSGKPCMAGFKIGHCSPNITIPLGIRVKMSTREKRVDGLESAVRE
ncbi:S66 peptidase family protein [Gorillibacterium massiliense]|uniref:S66 peptidase family protein n=1 Tax=Gorillibacterium massiliense TaxID=1280390 RepID=UPI0004BABFA3|nr:LD-carboxypeptidase [Gorillibacterium massiliense]